MLQTHAWPHSWIGLPVWHPPCITKHFLDTLKKFQPIQAPCTMEFLVNTRDIKISCYHYPIVLIRSNLPTCLHSYLLMGAYNTTPYSHIVSGQKAKDILSESWCDLLPNPLVLPVTIIPATPVPRSTECQACNIPSLAPVMAIISQLVYQSTSYVYLSYLSGFCI